MLKLMLLIPFLLLVACSGPGANSGFAPGVAIQPIVTPMVNTSKHVKHGEVVMTSNGWQVAHDNTDPVEQKNLLNGWTVEVKYE